jgi:hypothetical protein
MILGAASSLNMGFEISDVEASCFNAINLITITLAEEFK